MKGPVALAALLGVVGAVGGVAWFVQRSGSEADCADTVVAESRAPGGHWMAALFSRKCGVSETTQVALRRAGAPFAPFDYDVIFIAAGHEEVKLSWQVEPEVVIVETKAGRVIREGHSWRKVGVQVRRVR